MRILSFDIANKSLAHCCIDRNSNWISEFLNTTTIQGANDVVNSSVKWVVGGVTDLIPGKKLKDSNIQERTLALKKLLCELKKLRPDVVLVEYQMSANYNANVVFNQIIYEFTDDTTKVVVVKPMCKNTVWFKTDLKYQEFISKYSNKYCANKAHTKANFLYYVEIFGLSDVLKNIRKKNVDDLADAFIQIFPYIYNISEP